MRKITLKQAVTLMMMFSLFGCQTTQKSIFSDKEKELIYQKGYEKGIKENIDGIFETLQSNKKSYYVWNEPVRYRIKVPGRNYGNVRMPEHYTYVTTQPPRLKKRILQQKENKYEQSMEYIKLDGFDITALPAMYGFTEDSRKSQDDDSGSTVEDQE